MSSAERTPIDRRIAAGIFFAAMLVYNANLRFVGSYDGYASSLLPFRILGGHGLTLADPSSEPAATRYSIVRARDGAWRSRYPVVTPLLVTPLYVPAQAARALRLEEDLPYLRLLMEKLAASVLAAASAAALFLALGRVVSRRVALALALAFAFGTGTWVIASQALWQTGASGLLCALGLWALFDKGRAGGPVALGLWAGLLAANRPTDAVFAAALLAAGFRTFGRRSVAALVPVAAIGVAVLAYNINFFGHVLGEYGNIRGPGGEALGMTPGGLGGFVGLLVSNRGILVWCPFLLVASAGLVRRRPSPPGAMLFGLAWIVDLAIHGRHYDWMGGACYGPRFALHGLPLLLAALAAPLEWVLRFAAGRALFAATVLFSIALQAVGAFCFPGNDAVSERHMYSVADSSPVRAFRAGPQPPDFLDLVTWGRAPAPLSAGDALARYAWRTVPPLEWPADTIREVRLEVTNAGRASWSSAGGRLGRGGIRWLVRWLRPSPAGPTPVWSEERRAFASLAPGRTSAPLMAIASPNFEGPAILEIGLTQSGLASFEELGTPPLRASVVLRARRP